MNRRVYIAGKISNGGKANARDQYQAVRFAESYYEELIHNGWTPFLPHLSHHAWLAFQKDVHWPRWIEMDLDYIDSCAALIRLPNESIGADMEVEYAQERNIPVFFPNDPLHAVDLLEIALGKPRPRLKINKYIKRIEDFKNEKSL